MSFDFDATATDAAALRNVSALGVAIADRMSLAVRTDSWGTVNLETTSFRGVATRGSRIVETDVRSRDADYPLEASLRVEAQGMTLSASVAVTALAGFRYNRLGLCILHPVKTYAGRPFTLQGVEGPFSGTFPLDIAPQMLVDGALQPMFPLAFDRMTVSLPGADLSIEFRGDTFEIEDQRNWSDPSFKTYSTPLRLGTRSAHAGDTFNQALTLTIKPSALTTVNVDENEGEDEFTLPVVRLWDGPPVESAFRPRNGFPQLNRAHPTAAEMRDCDGLVFGINGSVHAADDDSVLGTASTHGAIIRQAIALAHGRPVHVGPLDFDSTAGEWRAGETLAPAPPRSSPDARREHGLGESWVIASLASAVPASPASLEYFDLSVAEMPTGRLIRDLGDRTGQRVRLVSLTSASVVLQVGDAEYSAALREPFGVARRYVR